MLTKVVFILDKIKHHSGNRSEIVWHSYDINIKYIRKYKEENKGDGQSRTALNEARMTS